MMHTLLRAVPLPVNLIILLLLMIGSPPVQAEARSALREVAYSREWLKLLHVKRTAFGKLESEVDDSDFFFSGKKIGKLDPEAELEATLKFFDREPSLQWGGIKQHPLCAFPARREFLERVLNKQFQNIPCKDFLDWVENIQPRSLTLVYSSSYPNNPASLFGHTFFRFNRAEINEAREQDLLNYGANYSAETEEGESSFLYMIKGLTGGYQGRYTLAPYYMKVNEYNHSESRDLWEFDLNLSPEKVMTLLKHLWELYGHASFKYYFLDENCSYEILTALEVAEPSWNLTSRFHVYVLPIETVLRVSEQAGAVTQVRYRPSNRKRLLSAYSILSTDEKDHLRKIIQGEPYSLQGSTKNELDTAIQYYGLKKNRKKGTLNETDSSRFKEVLLARSKLGMPASGAAVEPAWVAEHRPDRFHLTARLSLSLLADSVQLREYHFTFSAFHHDFLNAEVGFDPFSRVQIFTAQLSKPKTKDEIQVNEFEVIAMDSLYPYERIDPQLSWRIRAAVDTIPDRGCESCHRLMAKGGVGSGMNVFTSKNLLFALGTIEVEGSKEFRNTIRLSPGVDMGLILQPGRFPLRAQLLTSVKRNVLNAAAEENLVISISAGISYSLSSHFDIRFLYERTQSRSFHRTRVGPEFAYYF